MYGKSTDVYLNNELVPAQKVRKALGRYKTSIDMQYHEGCDSRPRFGMVISDNLQDQGPGTPPGFRLLTPPPERSRTPTPRGGSLGDSFPTHGVIPESHAFRIGGITPAASTCWC